MKSADTILAHAFVVTMDESYTVIDDGAVVIEGHSIVAVGATDPILAEYKTPEIVDCTGLIVTPGLVNAHTHVPMTLMRGLADDLRLDVWLLGYMMPVEREFVTPEFVRLGTLLACAEMIRGGVTAFADMYYYEDSVAQATAEAGMRGVCGQTVLKFPSPDSESYEAGLARCETFIQDWRGHELIVPAVAPHAPYTSTPEILRACADMARRYDVPLHIHLAETAQEVRDTRDAHDMPVIPWVKKHGILDTKVIAAHCVHVDEGEIHSLNNAHAGVAHNPSSNLKLASGIAPVDRMLDLGINVGVGTDGPASNNDLDMFEEMRLAAFLAKVNTNDPTALPARQAFDMATHMGARALHIDHLTGSIEPGKRADLAIIDLNRVHSLPSFERDPDAVYSRIVYSAKNTDVRDVICNGRWLMRNCELLTVDAETQLAEAAAVARKIDAFLTTREGDVLSKLLALGELQREESFEVQVKARVEDASVVDRLLAHPEVEVVKQTHYQQYDTYFEFDSPHGYRLRHREDDAVNPPGGVPSVRTRLTLTESGKEREFENAILLSRARYIAPATHPLRFYREYMQIENERTITKERRRWHIDFRGLRLYINLDQLIDPPADGYFLEIKSRTWSPTDAEQKSKAITELLDTAGVHTQDLIREEYITLTRSM